MQQRDVVLRDGTVARIRPIRPDDKDGLTEGLRGLSEKSRYLRFHTGIDHLTAEQLRYLTEIDYHDHMAWVAVDAAAAGEPGMGVARYVRLADEPTVAEAAVTVVDRYQGRGLGTVLLQTLTSTALDNGIRTFRNYVLADNAAMLEIFDAAGDTRVDEGGGVYRVDVGLHDREVATLEKVRNILVGAARGQLPPLQWRFVTLARRRGDRS